MISWLGEYLLPIALWLTIFHPDTITPAEDE